MVKKGKAAQEAHKAASMAISASDQAEVNAMQAINSAKQARINGTACNQAELAKHIQQEENAESLQRIAVEKRSEATSLTTLADEAQVQLNVANTEMLAEKVMVAEDCVAVATEKAEAAKQASEAAAQASAEANNAKQDAQAAANAVQLATAEGNKENAAKAKQQVALTQSIADQRHNEAEAALAMQGAKEAEAAKAKQTCLCANATALKAQLTLDAENKKVDAQSAEKASVQAGDEAAAAGQDVVKAEDEARKVSAQGDERNNSTEVLSKAAEEKVQALRAIAEEKQAVAQQAQVQWEQKKAAAVAATTQLAKIPAACAAYSANNTAVHKEPTAAKQVQALQNALNHAESEHTKVIKEATTANITAEVQMQRLVAAKHAAAGLAAPPAEVVPPTPAACGPLQLTAKTSRSLSLVWSAPPLQASAITGYELEQRVANTAKWQLSSPGVSIR